jgi:hypothetical protein
MASRPAFDPDHPPQAWVMLETYSTVVRERDQLRDELVKAYAINGEIAPLKARVEKINSILDDFAVPDEADDTPEWRAQLCKWSLEHAIEFGAEQDARIVAQVKRIEQLEQTIRDQRYYEKARGVLRITTLEAELETAQLWAGRWKCLAKCYQRMLRQVQR